MSTTDDIIRAIYRNELDTLASLLSLCDVNATDKHGRVPLSHAILADPPNPEMVAFLIDHGARVNIAERGGNCTPLHFAARDQRADIVRILLDAGVAIESVDSFGDTPLWTCVMVPDTKQEVVALLRGAGADPDHKNKSGVSAIDTAVTRGREDLLAMLR